MRRPSGLLSRPVGRGRLQVACSGTFNWANKANPRDPRPENVAGDFFVDSTCIDCDTCRWMAPSVFGRAGEQSAVHNQPTDEQGRVNALQALLSCPTFSIHVRQRNSSELRAAQDGLPAPVPGCPPGVYYTGWADEKSFGCCAYLLVRPEGNILVDSPRFNPVLAKRIAALGGVQWMFMTHRDDVGDHAKWAAHFGARRILHSGEVNAGTQDVEVQLEGEGPWQLRGEEVVQAPAGAGMGADAEGGSDITFIFTPGHTTSHVCMFHAPSRSMFTGDHLCADDATPGGFYIFSNFNWHSIPVQLSSVDRLRHYDFLHVLPGHGRRAHLRDAAARHAAIDALLAKHNHTPQAAAQAAAPSA